MPGFADVFRRGAPDTRRGRVLRRDGAGVMPLYVSYRADRICQRKSAFAVLPRDHVMNSKPGFHMRFGSLLGSSRVCLLSRASMWYTRVGVARLFATQCATGKCTEAVWRLLYVAIWPALFIVQSRSRPTRSEKPLA